MAGERGAGLRGLILAGFFLSGVTGLVYENLWIRMLTLVIGGTTAALTTVLIAFMGGLALGSFLFGSYADRAENPLRAYAIVEAAIGLYALVIPSAYEAVPGIYQALHGIDPEHGLPFTALRFFLAVAFFGIPSTLMGGTLPLIIKALSQGPGALQVTVARAYGINTFGATLGAFLTGFVVIPTFGLYLTLYLLSGVNFALAGVFYFALAPRLGADPVAEREEIEGRGEADAQRTADASEVPEPAGLALAGEVPAPQGDAPPLRSRRGLLFVFFLMGASSLSYEILWHRLLGLSFGSSVYAVSTMLTSFLLGIALGSWWYRRRAQEAPPTLITLAFIEVAIAASALFTVLCLTQLPYLIQYLYMLPYVFTKVMGPSGLDVGFWLLQLGLFAVATAVMLIPTSLMGASFPVAIHLFGGEKIGASVGRVYAANTFGSIVGSFLTGFVLIDALGTRDGILAWTAVNLALGAGLFLLARRWGEPARFGKVGVALLGALALGGALLGPAWSLDTLTSGVYYHIMGMERDTARGDVFFTREDDMGLVSLHRRARWDEPEPIQVMKINGKFMADDGGRVKTLKVFAHTPLFMHGPGAKRAMVIGLGGGYTAEAALAHPLASVEVAEISGAVVDAARVMNPRIFEDPRLKVVEEDARALLLTGEEPYDVIISETSDPWMTGVSNLYTEECFRWIRDRLTDEGIFGTWLQTRHKSVEDVKIILRTMNTVFPHMAVFQFGEGDTLLVMSKSPLKVDADFVRARFQEIAPQLRGIGIYAPFSIVGGLVLGEESLHAYLGEGPINTDDLPIIEFSTPRTLNIGLKGGEILEDLRGAARPAPDMPILGASPQEEALWRAWRLTRMERWEDALQAVQAAEALGAERQTYLRGRLALRMGDYAEALRQGRILPPSPQQALLVAGALTFLGDLEALETHLREGPGWALAEDRLGAKIVHRREILLEGLGLPPSAPGAAPAP